MRISPEQVIFVSVLVAGIGLAIAGVFVPPLLPCGVALIGLGTGIGQALAQRNNARSDIDRPDEVPVANVEASEQSGPDLHMHAEFDFHRPRPLILSQPPAHPDDGYYVDENAASHEAIDQQLHHHRPRSISRTR